ncbi:hypothetical protein CF15_03090 [Pyrodictium occultum]|uniref:Calcineurin-like phosphoesterase domain-containing protein n=1 Tax=Pyrodictium occultum TaxID=2309 RepID=A0A0V8RUS1_PYROC|nr:metallophosphoesterase [Pyrodictium occultum]KSW11803.1 hypothetical protein CF15_03090 [Pyrodictium occultum]
MKNLSRIMLVALILEVLLQTCGIAAAGTGQAGKVVEVNIPRPQSLAEYVPGLVLLPKLGRPAFVEPGGSFQLVISKPLHIRKIAIDDGYGHSYECSFAPGSLEVRVPDTAVHGLYDLIIYAEEGVYGEPHAVYVGSADDFKPMNIVHVTDRHFGVINSNGRSAANYDLAADIIAIGLPNNTIVFDTGDVADTAKDDEYMQAVLTDMLLDKPLVVVPGNHDHVGASENFKKYYGPFNQTLSIYGLYRIVIVDSGGDGYIDEGQALWASSVLAAAGEPVKIVAFHHPHFTHMFGDIPYRFNVSSGEQLYRLLLSNKPNSSYRYIYTSWLASPKALRILVDGIFSARARVVLVLSGHVHLNSYAEVVRPDGSLIRYVVTTATGGSVRPEDYHGFRIITVSPDGSVEIHGEGPYWMRHSSFNLEQVHVSYVETPTAVTATLLLGDTKVASYMKRTMVALHVPRSWLGKTAELYLRGLDHYQLRCTPLGCVLYAYANRPPVQGFEYQATLYIKPDKEPPVLRLEGITPSKPLQGRPVVLAVEVGDDSWGIKEIYAKLEYDGKTLTLKPMVMGGTARFVIPPLKAGKVKVTIVAVDASGKASYLTRVIEYRAFTTSVTRATTTHEAATTTTSTMHTGTTTAAAAAKTSTASTSATASTPATQEAAHTTASQPFSPTLTVPQLVASSPGSSSTAAQPAGSSSTTLLVAILVAAVLAAFTVLARR